MTQQDDFLGGLHYDSPRDGPVGPRTGIVRYYPVEPAPTRRVSPWWHVLGILVGALGIVVAAFAWGYGLDQLDHVRVRGLVALGLAGLVVGLMTLGRLSPAAPLTAGPVSLAGAVAHELAALPVLPVLRPVLDSGVPVAVGVLLVVLACRWR
ncbi:hypothetical protein ACQPZF_41510 [Actinosynnema sp. CS-041913]|uniref:hypothetical protein n=1 Tax=Actinosynnema sp. CS-041913 TaxID=3239917 RepID=UPI003D8A81FA